MTQNSEAPKLKKHLSYEDQVEAMIREKVISGAFAPGEKIPSSRKIAADLGTNSFTVHKALNVLRSEGLLISSVGKGTFVQKREKKLTCVGVYCSADRKGSPYANAVREELGRELHQAGIEMDLWMDPRPEDQMGEPWQPLVKAAEQRRFQAFISAGVDTYSFQWQRKLPVPMTFMGTTPTVVHNVDHDMRQFYEISLRELARQGCRSIGFIFPALTALHKGDAKGKFGWFDILQDFTDVVGELGLTVKNDWMRVVRDPMQHNAECQERFGYEQFLKLWSQPEKPEGLLVFTDVVARGALMAIREKQVRVPDELKLALSKNESIDLFCPMPATFVVASERDMARALIEQVQKQFRGEPCEPVSLPFKIVAHQ